MRSKRRSLFVVVVLTAAFLSSTGRPALAAVRRPTLHSLVVYALRHSTARRVAVAVEADGVGPLVSIGGTRWSRPASTQKLYVALLQLGPSNRSVTEIFRNGGVTRGGTLAGDLELAGSQARSRPAS